MATSKIYNAFISYSHAADGKLAPALQSALHRFGKSWRSLRAIRVFRDETNLSANPHLWSSIESALNQSEYLLLMASPGAAESAWVPKEIETFIQNNSADKILLILTGGELVWNSSAADFDWSRTTALPRLPARVFNDEPLWVDLRWARSEEHLDLQNPRFREVVAKISSAIRGIPLDVLIGRDVMEHRKTMRLAWSAVGALGALACVLAVTSWVAVQQRRRAEEERRVAIEQRNIALSRQLAVEARSFIGQRPDLALLLADQSTSIADTAEGRAALIDALKSRPNLVRYLHGHDAPVSALAFGKGGLLASGGRDGDARILLWDSNSGKLLKELQHAEKFRVELLAFSRDGKILVSAGDAGVVRVWDVATRRELRPAIEVHQSLLTSFAFNADGALAVGGGYGLLRLWDPRSGNPLSAPVQAHEEMAQLGGGSSQSNNIDALVFSPDGSTLLSGAIDGTIRRWDAKTLKRAGNPVEAHPHGVESLAFHPDGTILASGGYEGEIRLWTWPGMKPIGKHIKPHHDHVQLAYTPQGVLLSTDYAGDIRQWDGKTLEPIGQFASAPQGRVWTLAVRDDGLVATGGNDGTVMLWDQQIAGLRSIEAATRLFTSFPANAAHGIAFLGEDRLAAAGQDGVVRLWSIPDRKLVQEITVPGAKLEQIAASASGRLAIGLDNGDIHFGDPVTHAFAPPVHANEGMVCCLAFTSSGDRLASGDFIPGALRILDPVSRAALTPLVDAGLGYLWDLAFTPDGTVLAASGESGKIRLFNASNLHPLTPPIQAHKMGMNFLAFSPDGKLVSASGRMSDLDNIIQFRDARTGLPLGPAVGTPPVSKLAFTSGGKTLAGGGFDGTVQLWDGQTLQSLGVLTGAERQIVRHLAASPAGKIAAAGDNGTVTIWDADIAGWKQQARRIANRDLTPAERQRFLGLEANPAK